MSQITALIETVEELYTVHVELLELANKKRDVLIQGDIQELDRIVQEEMRYFQVISSLEQKRLDELKMIGIQERIPEKDLTLSRLQLLTHDVKEKARMQELTEKFPKVYNQLKEKNDTNARLLHQSLQFIQHTMHLLYPERDTYTYQPVDTGTNSTHRSSLYDFKA